jgi:hypothetical protein
MWKHDHGTARVQETLLHGLRYSRVREVSAENFVGRRDSALVTEKTFVLYVSGDYLPLKVPMTVFL